MVSPNKLRALNEPNGQPYILYGDPAYGLSRNILSPYRGQQLTQAENNFNRAISAICVSVEWTFGKVIQQFAYLDFRKNQKVLLQPIGKYYMVGTLLNYCHTCLYGSQTTTFSGVPQPTLEVYLSNK